MKNFKFKLLVILLLAAVPTVFITEINHAKFNAQPHQRDNQEMIEQKEAGGEKLPGDYISFVMVSIAL